MLLPSGHWKWYYHQTSDRLMLEMDAGMGFQTVYGQKQLTSIAIQSAFTIEHTQDYMALLDAIDASGVPFSVSESTQIGLNGAAALSFHKSINNKSWLYQKQGGTFDWHESRLAWLKSGDQTGLVITLQQSGDSVLCMLLSDSFNQSDGKTYNQFSLIRVLTDRLCELDCVDEESDLVQKVS